MSGPLPIVTPRVPAPLIPSEQSVGPLNTVAEIGAASPPSFHSPYDPGRVPSGYDDTTRSSRVGVQAAPAASCCARRLAVASTTPAVSQPITRIATPRRLLTRANVERDHVIRLRRH